MVHPYIIIVLENFAKLTDKDLRPSPTWVFYSQFYKNFESNFFTELFQTTAFEEEAWWSKHLTLLSFLKKIIVEIIGVFNSKSCWKKGLCSSPCWPLGSMLHVNFKPGLKFTLGWIQLYLWSKLSLRLHADTSWKLSPIVISMWFRHGPWKLSPPGDFKLK